jgi:hypothetical protein
VQAGLGRQVPEALSTKVERAGSAAQQAKVGFQVVVVLRALEAQRAVEVPRVAEVPRAVVAFRVPAAQQPAEV